MFILGNKAVTHGGWNYSGLQNYMQWHNDNTCVTSDLHTMTSNMYTIYTQTQLSYGSTVIQ